MSSWKKVLAFILAISMLLSVMSFSISAADMEEQRTNAILNAEPETTDKNNVSEATDVPETEPNNAPETETTDVPETEESIENIIDIPQHDSNNVSGISETDATVYPVLTLGEKSNVTLAAGEKAYFTFIPEEDDYYIFSSVVNGSRYDTYGTLYTVEDGNRQQITYNDDGAGNGQFRIEQVLTAGTEYLLEARMYNSSVSGSFDVLVEATPLDTVVFEPISMMEGTGGSQQSGYYQYNWWNKLKYTITMKNGDVVEGTGTGFSYDNKNYSISYSNTQSSSNSWTVDNTYTATVTVMGESFEVNVTITEFAAPSLSLGQGSSITLGAGECTYFSFTPEETDVYIFSSTMGMSNCETYGALYSVVDGNRQLVTSDNGTVNGNFMISRELTAGIEYILEVKSYNISKTFDVLVETTPLDVVFEPISIMEGTGGSQYTSYYQYNWWSKLKYTITMKNGDVVEGTGTRFNYNNQSYSISYYYNQSSSNPWTVGNTYTNNVTVMGKSFEVSVTITEFTAPSLSLDESQSVTLEAGESTYFLFIPEETDAYKFTSNSGETYCDTQGILYSVIDGKRNQLVSADSGASNGHFELSMELTAGTEYILEVFTHSSEQSTFDVLAEVTPLDSVVFEPITMMEGTGGSQQSSYYRYNWWNKLKYTVTMKNGDVVEGTGTSFNYDNNNYSISYSNTQSSYNSWTVGNTYTCELSVMGKKAEVSVTITEFTATPIVLNEAQPVTLNNNESTYFSFTPEETDFYFFSSNNGNNYCYTYGALYSVIDGSRQFITSNSYNNNGNFKISTELTAGTEYILEVRSYNSSQTTFNVLAEVSPVESVVFEPISIMEGTGGYQQSSYYEYYWWNKLKYTVTMKNGDVVEGTGTGFNYDDKYYSISSSDTQSSSNPWIVGNTYTCEVTVLGKKAEVSVSITEFTAPTLTLNQPQSITLDNNEYAYFSFTPEETDVYIFSSNNGNNYCPTYGALYSVIDGNRQQLASNSYNDNGNFRITIELTAGTEYLLQVRSYNSNQTTFNVLAEATPVESVVFEPITMMERTGGYQQSSYYEYYWWNKLKYTITMKNGDVVEGTGTGFNYDNKYYSISYSNPQSSSNPWTVGNTYTNTVTVLGVSAEVSVTITEFTATPIVLNESQSVTLGGGDREYFSFIPEETDIYIFTSESGGTYCDTHGILYSVVDGARNQLVSADSGASNGHFRISIELTAGTEYLLEVYTYSSAQSTFNVLAEATPVDSVVFEPISIMEGTGGYQQSSYYEYYWWNKLKYTVTMKNGDVVEGTGTRFNYDNKNYYINYSNTQYSSNAWTVGNTYTCEVTVLGKKAEVSVTITEFTASALILDQSQSVTLNNNEYTYFSFTPEETDIYIFSSNNGNNYCPTYGALYSVIDGSRQYITSNSYNNNGNFKISMELTAGTEYILEVRSNNLNQTTFNVLAEITPVKSVVIEPVSMMVGTGGYQSGDYYRYEWWYKLKYSITLRNNEVIEGNGNRFTYNGSYLYFDISDNQSFSNSWTVGNTYTCEVDVMGKKVDVSILITEFTATPIELNQSEDLSLGANDVVFFSFTPEVTGGYLFSSNSGNNYCDTYCTLYTIVDGVRQQITYNDDGAGNGNFMISENLTAGTEYVFGVKMDGSLVTGEFSVLLEETPIESIEFEPISVIENIDGYSSDGYFRYSWTNFFNYKLTFKNGEVVKSTGSSVYYNDRWYYFSTRDNQSNINAWTLGNTYNGTVSILGYSTEVAVTVVETPVESIKIEPIVLAENTYGHYSGGLYYYSWEGCVEYTITFKDGKQIVGSNSNYSPVYNGKSYNFIRRSDSQPWSVGNTYNIELEWLGVSGKSTITISEEKEVDGFRYILQGDNAIINGCSKTDTVLVIPAEIDGHTVIGVTDLSKSLRNAEELIIPDSVTMISTDLVWGCRNLKKITIGKGILRLDNSRFEYTYNLEEIVVSDENPNYTSIDGVVYNKDITEIIVFPLAKTGDYTFPDSLENADVLIKNLNKYDVDFDLGNSKVEYVLDSGVLYDKEMTTIIWVDKDMTGKYIMPDSVTTIQTNAFERCSFSEIVVSENVSDLVYYAFAYSMNLEKVVLPETLKTIEAGAFYGCENLKEADLPSGLNSMGIYAFYKTSVENVNIPSTLKTIEYATYCRAQIKNLTLNEGLQCIESRAFANSVVENVVLPDSLTELNYGAFMGSSLSSITFGKGIEYIPTSCFENSMLTEVYLPENITQIGSNAFFGAPLVSVTIKCPSIQIYGGAFSLCPIEYISFEEGDIYIGEGAFYNSGLKEFTFPQSVTDITYRSFAYSKDLLSIDLPDNLEYLDGTAFDGTAWFESQPDGVVYLENCLYGYKGDMPKGTEVVINEGTEIVASYAFDSEINMKQLTIPASVKYIEYSALNACLSLEKVIVDENNEFFYTNEDGTVLYNKEGYEIWRYGEIGTIIDAWGLRYIFEFGEEFSPSNWNDQVQIYFSGYCSCTLPISLIEFTGYNPYLSGEQEITMNVAGYEFKYTVTVAEFNPETIWIESMPNKTEYDLNQAFRTAGLVVMGEDAEGNSFKLNGYTLSGFDSTTAGTKTITVTYGDKEVTFEVVVNAEKITFVDTNNNNPETPTEEPPVEVSAPAGAIEDGAQLVVEQVPHDDAEENVELPEDFEEENSIIFDISFEKDEQKVQPTLTVTVSIPVPAGFNGRNCKVFHITIDGKVDMNAKYEDGYLVFTTTHFSYYGVVELDGFNVSGDITSYGVADGEVTVNLMQNEEVIYTTTSTNGHYDIAGVAGGEYTMTVLKANHATRTYTVTVDGDNVTQDVKIHLKGDIDGNGKLNVSDVGRANAHAKNTKLLDGYNFECADLDGNGKVNVSDVGKMNAHAKNTRPLW